MTDHDKAHAPAKQDASMDEVLNALDRVMRIFQAERMLYFVFGLASLALFLYAGYRFLSTGTPSSAVVAALLGSTGISAACSGRVVFFLNKAFGLIEIVIRSKTTGGG